MSSSKHGTGTLARCCSCCTGWAYSNVVGTIEWFERHKDELRAPHHVLPCWSMELFTSLVHLVRKFAKFRAFHFSFQHLLTYSSENDLATRFKTQIVHVPVLLNDTKKLFVDLAAASQESLIKAIVANWPAGLCVCFHCKKHDLYLEINIDC